MFKKILFAAFLVQGYVFFTFKPYNFQSFMVDKCGFLMYLAYYSYVLVKKYKSLKTEI